MASQPVGYLSPEKYLELERAAEFRSEYIGGQMFAMAGGTLNHARICRNALNALSNALIGRQCEAAGSDLRLFSNASGTYTYPDAAVFCGSPRYKDKSRDTITDATVIVEVLSPGSQSYDRGDKFLYYRGLPSFSDYLLIAEHAIEAEHRTRQSDGFWLTRFHTGSSAVIELPSIDCRLTLGDLYDRVEFTADPSA